MNTLPVEQAVFTSSDRGPIKGYQLVSRSMGIDRGVSAELCRWAPTRVASERADDWTLNCFPVGDGLVAITRTTLGGPEYSGRGGTQVVTLILVLRSEQLQGYEFNSLAVARTAMAMGHLKLPLDVECEPLPPVKLPAYPISDSACSIGSDLAGQRDSSDQEESLLRQVTALISDGRRVAIAGNVDPIVTVNRLIQRLPLDIRRSFSFTTGLAPSVRRPFQVHFFAAVDLPMQHSLDSQNVVCLTVPK